MGTIRVGLQTFGISDARRFRYNLYSYFYIIDSAVRVRSELGTEKTRLGEIIGKQVAELTVGAALILTSDIHLRSPECPRGQLLLQVLRQLRGADLECFVLLGDIFDFCLGSNRYFQKKFAPIGAELSRLAAEGTRVLFFEGNHEFRMVDLGWRGVEFVTAGNAKIRGRDGVEILMAHGDLIYSSQVYRRFRTLVKSRFVTGVAQRLPGTFVESFALKNSEASRAYDRYRDIDHTSILSAAGSWLAENGSSIGIFGHFHVPYAEPLGGSEARLLSSDSWDIPSFLVRHEGRFQRLHIEPTPRLMPLASIASLGKSHAT